MSTSDRFPLAAKARFSEEELDAMASPVLSGTRLAFEWNKGALEPLVRSFMKVEPEDPSPDPEDQTPLPDDHDQQPVWDMVDNQSQRPDALLNDETTQRDFLAFYKAACRAKPSDYGIHFRVGKIRGLALRLEKRLHDLTKASRPVEESEVLEALIVKIFWHETGHAWIEDIAASIEPSLEKYNSAQERWGAYIFMEEAICNTIALRMLRFYLRESRTSPMIKTFTEFMKTQGKGYNRFEDLGPWGDKQDVLEKNIIRLLTEVYDYDDKDADKWTIDFFAHDAQLKWMTHDRHHISPSSPMHPSGTRNLYMQHWKHPLHAHQAQLPSARLLLVAIELANSLKSGKETSKLKAEVETILDQHPEAIHASDFIGPDAALRICDGLLEYLPLGLLKKLKVLPESVDCYRRVSPLNKRLPVTKIFKELATRGSNAPWLI
jgi:hypothetical protein